MSTRKVILGLAVCLSLGVFAQQLLSQGTGSGGSVSMPSRSTMQRMAVQPDFERMSKMSPEEKMKYLQQITEQQRKWLEEQEAIAMQQALGADDKQWKVIEPRLKKVKRYKEQAFIGTKLPKSNFTTFSTGPGGAQGFGMMGGGFGGGSGGGGSVQGGTFQNVPGRQDFDGPRSDGEILCEEIQMLLNDPQTTPEQVNRKLVALRQEREKARRQWVAAQQQLREVLDFRQQARLVLMGLLD